MMKVRPNIGILNALMRITIGFTLLSWATAKMVKRPWRDSYLMVAMIAAMKIGEGFLRYCPMTALYEKCQCMIEDMNQDNEKTASEDDTLGASIYNPS